MSSSAILLFAAVASSCAPSGSSAVLASAPAARAGEPAQILAIDPGRSRITALGRKITGSHLLTFPAVSGEIGLAGGQPASVRVKVSLPALQTDSERLTAHLLSGDFFDAASFPLASFASSSIAVGASSAGATHTVTGDLVIRGVTRRIQFPAFIAPDGVGFSGKAAITLDRQDYGVRFPGKPDDLIQDEVVLSVELAG